MKQSLVLLTALASLAVSSPVAEHVVEKRQNIDFAAYNAVPVLPAVAAPAGDAAPQSATYNPTVVASSAASAATDNSSSIVVVEKRWPASGCTTRSYNGPKIAGPTDSPDAFKAWPAFAAAASAAAADPAIPSGYALVPDFVNLNGSVEDSHYLTYTTEGIFAYEPEICAARCNDIAGCNAFNIYYERVPLIVSPLTGSPDDEHCPARPDSPSATLIKCAFYGAPIRRSQATNCGQWEGGEGNFQVVITGSNGYIKTCAPSLKGWEGPVAFKGAINAPAPVIDHGYLQVQTFGQNVPYDPSLCASACNAQTVYNANHPSVGLGPCVFFDAYILYENGINGVFTCTYYSTPYGAEYATMTGQYDQAGNYYGVGNSYGYYLDGHYVD